MGEQLGGRFFRQAENGFCDEKKKHRNEEGAPDIAGK